MINMEKRFNSKEVTLGTKLRNVNTDDIWTVKAYNDVPFTNKQKITVYTLVKDDMEMRINIRHIRKHWVIV